VSWFRRQDDIDPLPVTMTGVRLGDRLLVAGAADPQLVALLARKTGLTGRVVVVVSDDARAARAATEIERAGALVEMVHAPWSELPLDNASFDIAVAPDALWSMAQQVPSQFLADARRLLRPGGRIVVIEPVPRRGLSSLLSRQSADPSYSERGGAVAALTAAGFTAARTLATRGGVVYIEAAVRA
jgi:ubiquinone/menaquinone biosynthesis C-methylase UbiE